MEETILKKLRDWQLMHTANYIQKIKIANDLKNNNEGQRRIGNLMSSHEIEIPKAHIRLPFKVAEQAGNFFTGKHHKPLVYGFIKIVKPGENKLIFPRGESLERYSDSLAFDTIIKGIAKVDSFDESKVKNKEKSAYPWLMSSMRNNFFKDQVLTMKWRLLSEDIDQNWLNNEIKEYKAEEDEVNSFLKMEDEKSFVKNFDRLKYRIRNEIIPSFRFKRREVADYIISELETEKEPIGYMRLIKLRAMVKFQITRGEYDTILCLLRTKIEESGLWGELFK
jgi:hypothetical protein